MRRTAQSVASATPTPQPDSSAQASDATIISTADAPSSDRSRTPKTTPPNSDADLMRRSVDKLSNDVIKLTEKMNQMEEQQRTLVDLERLSRSEQRAENLRAQLRDVQAKEADLQARAEQIDYALQPDNIERAVATLGTTRPEVARDQRRQQLENEKGRVRAQLDQLATSRAHLESAIATADAETEKIRERVNAATTTQTTTTNSGSTTTEFPSTTVTTPSTPPMPPPPM